MARELLAEERCRNEEHRDSGLSFLYGDTLRPLRESVDGGARDSTVLNVVGDWLATDEARDLIHVGDLPYDAFNETVEV